MSDSPRGPFFGILSRHFVESFMHQLSKVAVRTYSYLRTWCISKAGQGSEWVELRVERIADALQWSTRYVRRGLAELRAANLIESRERWVMVDGSRCQMPNEWRVLPEPGFPAVADPEEAAPPPPPDPPPPPRADRSDDVVQAIDQAVEEAVAAVPGWITAEAQAEAEKAADAAEMAADYHERPDRYVDPHLGERWATREAILQLAAEADAQASEHMERATQLQLYTALPPAQLAATRDMRERVVAAAQRRAWEILTWRGARKRTLESRVTWGHVDERLARYLAIPRDGC